MAKIYLESSDSRYVIANSNVTVIGASGAQTLVINDGVTGVDVSSTVEALEFSGNFANYELRQVPSSTRVEVLDGSGRVAVNISVAGQSLNFSDGARQLSTTFNPSLGTVEILVDGVSLSPDSSSDISDSVMSSALAQSNTIASIDAEPTNQTDYVPTLMVQDLAWSSQSLTYGYPTSIPADHTSYGSETSDGWRALTVQEQQIFDGIVASQNKFIALDLQKAANGNSADIRVVAVNQDANTEAFAFFPGSDIGGDVFLNANGGVDNDGYFNANGFALTAMAHELGHAMALKHPFEDFPLLATELDNLYYTIMTYTDAGSVRSVVTTFENSGGGYSISPSDAYRSELGIFDVAALQSQYGADMQTNVTNTTYVFDESERQFIGADGYYKTIWDAGGEDTLDCSDAAYMCVLDLNDYTVSSISQRTIAEEALAARVSGGVSAQYDDEIIAYIENLGERAFLNEKNLGIAFGTVIENVITGQGNDTVTDNQVDNEITTGAGNDLIVLGNGGYDVINGGIGFDTVRLTVASTDVQTFEDETGFYIAAADFGAQLIGVERIEYSDTTFVV